MELREEILQDCIWFKSNCRNITQIINWGVPTSLEELVQETGRGGRDGSEAEAILNYMGKEPTSIFPR